MDDSDLWLAAASWTRPIVSDRSKAGLALSAQAGPYNYDERYMIASSIVGHSVFLVVLLKVCLVSPNRCSEP